MIVNTVNGERFAGLNFHGFRGFQEYHESFSVNISASLKCKSKCAGVLATNLFSI